MLDIHNGAEVDNEAHECGQQYNHEECTGGRKDIFDEVFAVQSPEMVTNIGHAKLE